MAVYYIGSYDIVDPAEFQKYPPVVMSLLPKYGGEVLASDTAALLVEGHARTMNAIIRFPSKEAALGLYNDPDYQEAKRVRQRSTANVSMVLVESFAGASSEGISSRVEFGEGSSVEPRRDVGDGALDARGGQSRTRREKRG
jgi:uncharacterized protein (DUF1330 family)